MNFIKLLSSLFVMKNNMSKNRNQVIKLREKKLRTMLKHAYANSPYYRKAFQKAGIYGDQIDSRPLSDFPIIDKETLMNNFDLVVTVDGVSQNALRKFDEEASVDKGLFQDKYYIVHSSGSTGTPRYFLYDDEAWNKMLLGIIRAAAWDLSIPGLLKVLAGGIRILYIAAVNGRYGGAMAVGGGVDSLKGKRLFIDVNTPLPEWKDKIEKFNPNIIIGYPSALKILADIKKQEDVRLDVSRVISCGEPLSTGMRSYYEEVFCKIIINVYGASESLAMGVETSAKEGMYLFDDLNYIEIQDDGIYLTSLYNFIQPLIRYKISDKLLPVDNSVYQKYPFTLVKVLLSRDEDVLWFRSEQRSADFLHPLSIEGFCIDGLLDYQFIKNSVSGFTMLAVVPEEKKRDGVKTEMIIRMDELLKEKNLQYVDFSIQFASEIQPDPETGKKRLIIDQQSDRSVI